MFMYADVDDVHSVIAKIDPHDCHIGQNFVA